MAVVEEAVDVVMVEEVGVEEAVMDVVVLVEVVEVVEEEATDGMLDEAVDLECECRLLRSSTRDMRKTECTTRAYESLHIT